MKFIDIHCHVHFPEYDEDRDEVIKRALSADIGIIFIGTDIETSRAAVALAEKYENVWAVIGSHPTYTVTSADFEYNDYKKLLKLASNPKVVGIGECGLDYFHADADDSAVRQNQIEIFTMHIRLAYEIGKPLVLHIRNGKDSARNAYDDAIEILKKAKMDGQNVSGDVHFFAGDLGCAQKFIELGLYLSFTGVITFVKEYHAVVAGIPLDRIMSETDAPFVAPVPHRGRRNEPSYVREVAKTIAEIRMAAHPEENEKVIFDALVNNAKRLFNI